MKPNSGGQDSLGKEGSADPWQRKEGLITPAIFGKKALSSDPCGDTGTRVYMRSKRCGLFFSKAESKIFSTLSSIKNWTKKNVAEQKSG